MPELSLFQEHAYRASHPSGSESPSESMLLGSVADQFVAASAVSP